MPIIHRRITITQVRKPVKKNLNEELQWIGSSLGLFNPRDKDKSCFRIFIEMLKATKVNKPMTSDQLAYKTGLSRGTVVHHLNKMRQAGLIITSEGGYLLRVGKLEAVIDEIQKDMNRACDDMRKIARDIDDKLGL